METPPHQAEFLFSLGVFGPLPARGAREAVPAASRVLRGLLSSPKSQRSGEMP
jgi:hypothetical protein